MARKPACGRLHSSATSVAEPNPDASCVAGAVVRLHGSERTKRSSAAAGRKARLELADGGGPPCLRIGRRPPDEEIAHWQVLSCQGVCEELHSLVEDLATTVADLASERHHRQQLHGTPQLWRSVE